VLCNPKGRSQDKFVANCHEYLIGYSKSAMDKGQLDVPKSLDEVEENYKLSDARGVYRELELRNTHREFGKHNRSNLYYPFYVNSAGQVALAPAVGYEAIFPIWEDGFEGCWTWGVEKATNQLGEVVAKKVKGTWKIYRKNYAFGEDGEASKQVKSIWVEKGFHTEKGQATFNELFESKGKIFQSPKSISTLVQLLLMSSAKDSLVVDFFSGSASMAQAAMQLNLEDGGSRRWLLVQIPDLTDETSDAFKAGFKTIAEIGKERIRRAGRKIKHDSARKAGVDKLDVGFRVLKIDSSNMKEVFYTPDAVSQDLLSDQVNNIREDRTPEDLLFQVLLDWGVDLALPIAQETIAGKAVYFVDGNALAACFEEGVSEEFVKLLAKREPLRVVFRDAGFASDSVKINVEQIFKLMSPSTEVKTI
jgi:adenine-specific DNA-methyltransferase